MERIRIKEQHRIHGSNNTKSHKTERSTSNSKRIKSILPEVKKPTRIRLTNTRTKGANEFGVYKKEDGVSYKLVLCDGERIEWPCSETGFIKDGRTSTHVAHYGRIFKLMTEEESKAADIAVVRRMILCFPNSKLQPKFNGDAYDR